MALEEGKRGLTENRISHKFLELKLQNLKGLITFVTAGFPDLDSTAGLVYELERAGADIIELGVPYSDPLADGPIIQQASLQAIKKGTNLTKIFESVGHIRMKSTIPIVLMTYYNPVVKYGLTNFAEKAAEAGVDGVIVPDLPFEESVYLATRLQEKGIHLIPLVAPTSGKERIARITSGDKGFVYCVSLTGVTGLRSRVPEGLQEFMADVREVTNNPLAVGFGISNPYQVREVAKYCDAVIVGSALVKTIEENLDKPDFIEKVGCFVAQMKDALCK